MTAAMLTFYGDVQRPLAAEEVDANFRNLDDRQREMEAKGVEAVSISDLVYDASAGTILIALSNGVTYGPYGLPVSLFVPRGDWAPLTAYHLRDYASYAGGSYVCLGDHKSTGVFADDLVAGRWQVISLKGTDGKAGEPFATYVGFYDPTRVYKAAEMVLYAHPTLGFGLWRLTYAAPVGTAPGTVDPSTQAPYWQGMSPPAQTAETELAVIGKPVPGAVLLRRRFARARTYASGLSGSVAALGTATTAAMTIELRKNGSAFGAVSFAAGSKIATLSTAQATTFAPGDVLTIVQTAPSSQDATAADLDISLIATLIA